ncbi:MAG: flavodoxin family protein [Planctomycetota bacterium]|jgi:NAD(P)H-dependent FMN reductase
MKVLILNASPRKKGVTSILLAEIGNNISSTHSVETVAIDRMNMKPCRGCLKCRPDKECVLPKDDAHDLAQKVKESDLLIIGSPVYWGNIPGSLKIFFDRNVPLFEYVEAKPMNRIPTPRLADKRAILVISSASPFPYNLLISQSRGTIRALKTILKSGGIRIERILNVPDSYNFSTKGEKYLQKARRIGSSI